MVGWVIRRLDPRASLARRRLTSFVRPVQEFVQTESASAVLLILAAAAALIWANSPWQHHYEELLETRVGVDLAFWAVEGSLHFWVNELGMVIFFFLIGLEVKREITIGELSDPRVMAAPVIGAVGGMLLPLGIFLLVTQGAGAEAREGWAIPMATDVAFALGIATLFATRVPLGLRAMLLTFVIVDDIGTVVVVALFYSGDVQVDQLLLTVGLVALMLVAYRLGVRSMFVFAGIGVVAWAAIHDSGVHPTTLGAVLGFLTPWRPPVPLDGFVRTARQLLERFRAGDEEPETPLGHDQMVDSLLSLSDLSSNAVPHVDRLEHHLHPWVAYLVVPAFALANAGVHLDPGGLTDAFTSTVTWGIIVGLVVGKPVGLVAATGLAVLLGAHRPAGVTWRGVWAIGFVAGIGFTVALFVGDLAYSDPDLLRFSKIGIIAAFAITGPLAFLAFRLLPRVDKPEAGPPVSATPVDEAAAAPQDRALPGERAYGRGDRDS
ncbi:MAG: Na+/H+ antiporter NhaA [Dehalococcoidia bacterium]|nr:Na+/H+ antiporter NhaA [Dehalococcoidia bacterium]MYA52387.1 Na+/H+ antiporter NhaA [Dehalococcoidia bacterium]